MRKTTLGPLVALALAACPAAAQLESPLLSKVQVNIVNPGGKSLAMGGAFVSVADDATAAIANPAGLPQLAAYQLGASGKYFRFEPKLDTANFFQNTSTGAITQQDTDRYDPRDSATELEFASVVLPVFQNLVLAVFRNVNLRYSLDGNEIAKLPGGNYRLFFVNREVGSGVSLDEAGGLDLRNEQYGISAGTRFGIVSLGAGITVNKLRFDLTGGPDLASHRFIINEVNRASGLGESPVDVDVASSIDSGRKVGWLVGFKLTLDEARNVAIGGVYRRNPEFDLKYSFVFTDARTHVSTPFSCDAPLAGTVGPCGTFRVPDDYSIGISGRPFPALLVAVEVQRIRYSQLNNGYVPVVVYRYPFPTNNKRAVSDATSDDGTLPRVGLEYTLRMSGGNEVNLRAGYFHEPAHGTQARLFADDSPADRAPDNGTEIGAEPFGTAYRTTFNGGEGENHYSFGLGATLSRRFSVDVAFDYSKTTKSGVVSAFVRF